jgi:RNA polymerase sigma-70 factor (ECF subfamily)
VEARDELHRSLQALSDEERVAVALKYGGDLSLREIAELLEERETTVEGRVYRGLRRLRETLV